MSTLVPQPAPSPAPVPQPAGDGGPAGAPQPIPPAPAPAVPDPGDTAALRRQIGRLHRAVVGVAVALAALLAVALLYLLLCHPRLVGPLGAWGSLIGGLGGVVVAAVAVMAGRRTQD
ncbi:MULTISPECIES: hypothetical protein [Streptomyces]|uniref:hypothetical protein n=1 Tax=Streptomyces TaxID=1883 RepID=UPI00163C2D4E|nr:MULTISPECIES: hypothetical protein [Streptomyces]MBC2879800.1 hypothetical protein [Streptomyces sp. TYQ1024]UBI41406.1 hypothetical protein K7I03_33620 [Streptomyces mobaraensis]